MTASFLARRYLTKSKGRLFARFLTIVAIGSVTISVFALMITIGIFHGFGKHLRAKLLGFSPDITIVAADDITAPLLTWAGSADAAVVPIIEGEVAAQPIGREGFSDLGVRVRGIAPAHLNYLSGARFYYASHLADGDRPPHDAGLAMDETTGRGGAVVGSEVLFMLGVHPETEDQIRLTAPLGLIDPAGNLRPITREFMARGFFRTGIYAHDSKLIFLDFAEAEALLGAQANRQWQIFVEEGVDSDALAEQLRTRFGQTATVTTWRQANAKLFGALRLERMVMTILLILALGMASLSILGVVLMQVRSRQRDMAILAAIGASRQMTQQLVLRLGAAMGIIGTGLGVVLGAGLMWWVAQYPIQLPSSFYLETLPIEIDVGGFLFVLLVGIGLPTIASWYPACVAGRMAPAEGLRSE